MRLCYLCYRDGNIVQPTHLYYTKTGEQFDVCDKHAEECRLDGLIIFMIDPSNVVREEG